MQIEKALKNDRLHVSKISWKFRIPTVYNFTSNLPVKIGNFSKGSLLFNSFYFFFLFINKALRLNNLKTRTAMNVKFSVFVICVEQIIYLLLHKMDACTFK